MSLKVGIHENVYLEDVIKPTGGGLQIKIKQVVEDFDAVAALESVEDEEVEAPGASILLYGLKTNAFNKDLTGDQIFKNINNLKVQLTEILLSYYAKDKIKWSIFSNTSVDTTNTETVKESITNQATLDEVTDRIYEYFIDMVKPFLNTTDKLFRVKFVRQSKPNHFPKLPIRGFWESMDIPVDKSKLAFNEWEVNNGYNNPDPVVATPDVADKTEGVEDVFKD